MKRIGGKSIFNYKTMKMENQPVHYTEFHCTPKEWKSIRGQYLVRDWVDQLDIDKLIWEEDYQLINFLELAVKEIICERYFLHIVEIHDDNFSNHKRIKIYVQDDVEPVETFLNDINFNTVCFTREELIDVTYTVVKSIFDLINYYQKYPQWVGKYTIHSGGASTDCVTKK